MSSECLTREGRTTPKKNLGDRGYSLLVEEHQDEINDAEGDPDTVEDTGGCRKNDIG